ncbi:hypothetical protein AM571_CH03297 [Rhizobium etli 8C-3]|uniref:Uncharacterized protein n=1 Tax=Rhizobium etli 8C-3 TaxID=538025 RepID=A0A1L5P7I5_RHIET|nr:hypothetical protein [Rhizobium etli]APO76091.1 hypothetical protein AM571_CH03297 [Rhizobium etli 8C-3]
MEPLSKPLAIALATGALLLAVASLGYLTVREIHAMTDEAATAAKQLSDATWTARIEKANAEANQKIADQAKAVIQIQAEAADRVNAASQQLEEVRKRNAALPHGDDIGLSADRVRLLPD